MVSPVSLRRRFASKSDDERGMTLIELSIASAILLLALATFLAALASSQKTQAYADETKDVLDEARQAALAFSKDARQAYEVPFNNSNRVEFRTYVNGSQATVVWRVNEGGNGRLERVQGAVTRVFPVQLVAGSTLGYQDRLIGSPPAIAPYPEHVGTIKLNLAAVVHRAHSPVQLSNEVALRNVK